MIDAVQICSFIVGKELGRAGRTRKKKDAKEKAVQMEGGKWEMG